MTDFEKKYVTTNNRLDAPDYDPKFVSQLHTNLISEAPELKGIEYAVLTALAVGAHRADIVPRLFENAAADAKDDEEVKSIFFQIRGTLLVIWPFIGIPWCVPAQLGLVNVLKTRGLEKIAEGRTRPDLQPEDRDVGLALLKKTYANVQNSEVQEMLKTYFADFTEFTWTVVFGYSLAGTAATGLFQEKECQLLLATSIAASGATRQAKSHGKGAIGLGNRIEAVSATLKAAEDLNAWNKNPIAHINATEF